MGYAGIDESAVKATSLPYAKILKHKTGTMVSDLVEVECCGTTLSEAVKRTHELMEKYGK